MLDTEPLPVVEVAAPAAAAPKPSLPKARLLVQLVLGVAALIIGLVVPTVAGSVRLAVGAVGAYAAVSAVHRWWVHRTGRALTLGTILSAAWLVLLTALAALADVLPLAEGRDPSKTLAEPAMLPPNLLSDHPFGTDTQALDVLAALLYGARVSVVIAVGAVSIALVVGGILGVLSGYFRGWIDMVIGFLTDAMLAFPALILLLALASILQPTVFNVTIALGALGIPGTVRLARASTLAVASREFVVASRTLGARTGRIMLREVVPNVAPPLIAYGFVIVGFLIVAEASLSFLGLGIQRPNPTWGNLIWQGQAHLETEPYLVMLPSLFLFLTVMSSNYVGQRLQQRWAI